MTTQRTPSLASDRLLRLATIAGDVTAATFHLSKGADPNAIDSSGKTPLIVAVQRSHVNICKILLASGADPFHKDYSGQSAIDYSSQMSPQPLVGILEPVYLSLPVSQALPQEPVPSGAPIDIGNPETDTSDGWEEIPQQAPPPANEVLLELLRSQSTQLAGFKPKTTDIDWTDIVVDLPDLAPLGRPKKSGPFLKTLMGTFRDLSRQEGTGRISWTWLENNHPEISSETKQDLLIWADAQYGIRTGIENTDSNLAILTHWLTKEEIDVNGDEILFWLNEIVGSEGDPYFSYLLDVASCGRLTVEEEIEVATELNTVDQELLHHICNSADIFSSLIVLFRKEFAPKQSTGIGSDLNSGIVDVVDSDDLGQISSNLDEPTEHFQIDPKEASTILLTLDAEAGRLPFSSPEMRESFVHKVGPSATTLDALLKLLHEDHEHSVRLKDLLSKRRQLRDRMVTSNLRLVIAIAKKYFYSGIPILDLIQEGNLGLIKAVERFKAERGNRFSTYATWWIKQMMSRYVYNNQRVIRIPVHMEEEIRRVHAAFLEVEGIDDSISTIESVANLASLTIERVRWIRAVSSEVESLDELESSYTEPLYLPLWYAFDDFVAQAELGELRTVLNRVLANLEERQEQIVRYRNGYGNVQALTLEQLGGRLGITRERVRQLESKALSKLRIPRVLAPLDGFVSNDKIEAIHKET